MSVSACRCVSIERRLLREIGDPVNIQDYIDTYMAYTNMKALVWADYNHEKIASKTADGKISSTFTTMY